jgi:hypothetical protein
MPSNRNGKSNGKTNGKKINGTTMGKLVDPNSSDLHPDVVRFMQTVAWVKNKHEIENRPKLEELRQHAETQSQHCEDARKRTAKISEYFASSDDDPVIFIVDLLDPITES